MLYMICDLLKFKFSRDETSRELPLAKPGVQRRADENILKPSDKQAPLVQAPSAKTSDTSNKTEAPVTTSTTPLYKQVSFSTSRAPIPLAVTGGFQSTQGGNLNSKADTHKLNILGGSSSTHHTLIIGDNVKMAKPSKEAAS